MKKSWLLGFALAIGASTVAGEVRAQYNNYNYAPSYAPNNSGALAPNGFPLQRQGYPAFTVGYAQEQVQANAVPQAVNQGWNGAADGQYQGIPVPQVPGAAQQYAQPQQVPQYNGGGMHQAPAPAYQGQMSYPQDPGYGAAIAPNAMSYSGTGGCNDGSCGTAGYPAYQGYKGDSCGPGTRFLGCGPRCGGNWFVGGGALLFQRIDDHPVGLTYDMAMPTPNLMTTGSAQQDNLPGFEVFGGRYFNCGRNAIMFDYWGLYPSDSSATVYEGGGVMLNTRLPFTGLYSGGMPIYNEYNNSQAHQVVRGSQYNNVEINLLGFGIGGASRSIGYGGGCCNPCGSCSPCGSGCGGNFAGPCGLTPAACGSRLNLSWLAGVRWFQFRDQLRYSASTADTNFTGGADDYYFDNNVRNDLVGFQLGNVLNYCCGSRVNLYALAKAGVYNNNANYYSTVTNNGMPATITSTNAYNGNDYVVNVSRNNVAFLGEIGSGLGVCICRGWSLNAGYRVIGASGVATSVNTLPYDTSHLGNVGYFNNTSSVVLHGVTLGTTYNF